MPKSAIVDHLEAALVLARSEDADFLAYLIGMAKAAAEQLQREVSKPKIVVSHPYANDR